MYLPLLVKEVPISIVVGLLTYLDKSVNMRAWLKVNNDSLVDMACEHIEPCYNLQHCYMHSDGLAL